ncbi:O-methyltransferase, family 2 [Corchorus capsularis]|uniref:O-methyltransferase, family 2 n=1 Tax=Corchorus capsularis TaxID=210143 RepID=A0A1R3HRA6_COCAP|nr:O-methyltransferase, family 2 [Corchorus capsularis]
MESIKADHEGVDELLQAQSHVWNHLLRFISSMSLKCAVELEIPDIIHNHGQPITISELALALSIHPPKVQSLYRLMRILVHSGFFAEHKISGQEKGYKLTLSSKLLLKDDPLSTRHFFLAMLDPVFMKPWQYVSAWFQNDDPVPFSTANGKIMWDYAANEPKMNHLFNEAMASDGLLIASAVLSKCKGVFQGLESLVDVAGGTGTLTKVLAKTYPNMDCTVFDLPHVVAGLQGSENLKYIGGNMFEKVPPGEAILLKWILHDWNDEECVKILKVCKEAIGSKDKGKLIIIDIVMEKQDADEQTIEAELYWDMLMMALPNGRERNEEEWNKLFVDAGFNHYKIYHVLGIRSLIELFP